MKSNTKSYLACASRAVENHGFSTYQCPSKDGNWYNTNFSRSFSFTAKDDDEQRIFYHASEFEPTNYKKQIGRLFGKVVKGKKDDSIYLIKSGNIDGTIHNYSHYEARYEFLISRFMKAALSQSALCEEIIVPKTYMVIVPVSDQENSLLFASKIIFLDQYLTSKTIESYEKRMLETLRENHFAPLSYTMIHLAIVGSCDHPGPGLSNIGIEFIRRRMAIFDFDHGLGESEPKTFPIRNFSDKDFLIDFDYMRGIVSGKLVPELLQTFNVGTRIFASYITFDSITKSKILSADKISLIVNQAFSDYDKSDKKSSGQIEHIKQKTTEVLIKRAKDAEDLQKIAGLMSKDLTSHQLLPSATLLIEATEKLGGKEELAKLPSDQRQKLIDDLNKESDLEKLSLYYKKIFEENPIKAFKPKSKEEYYAISHSR